MPSKLDQTEVALWNLSDGDCNYNSELEEEQTDVVIVEAWKIKTNDN